MMVIKILKLKHKFEIKQPRYISYHWGHSAHNLRPRVNRICLKRLQTRTVFHRILRVTRALLSTRISSSELPMSWAPSQSRGWIISKLAYFPISLFHFPKHFLFVQLCFSFRFYLAAHVGSFQLHCSGQDRRQVVFRQMARVVIIPKRVEWHDFFKQSFSFAISRWLPNIKLEFFFKGVNTYYVHSAIITEFTRWLKQFIW